MDHDSSLTCFIVMETGESLEIEGLLPSTTIEELKEIIYDHNPKIPSKRQRLTYAGAPLAPDLTLSDYKIKHLCVINLDREFQRMAVMRKPVILLYPPNVLEEVSVRISLHSEMKFSALYPRPCKGAVPRSGESTVRAHVAAPNPHGGRFGDCIWSRMSFKMSGLGR